MKHSASTNLILSLYPPNLSPSSKFILCQSFVIGAKAFRRHYILKKHERNDSSLISLDRSMELAQKIFIIHEHYENTLGIGSLLLPKLDVNHEEKLSHFKERPNIIVCQVTLEI